MENFTHGERQLQDRPVFQFYNRQQQESENDRGKQDKHFGLLYNL